MISLRKSFNHFTRFFPSNFDSRFVKFLVAPRRPDFAECDQLVRNSSFNDKLKTLRQTNDNDPRESIEDVADLSHSFRGHQDNVASSLVDPAFAALPSWARRRAEKARRRLAPLQSGRRWVAADYESGIVDPWSLYLETFTELENFLCRLTQKADERTLPLIVDTQGISNHWESARRRLDGAAFLPNGESCGVSVVGMRTTGGAKNDAAVVNLRRMILDENLGSPVLPATFHHLLLHPNVVLINASVATDLKRLENSFGRLDGACYACLDDLVARWACPNSADFVVDPFVSAGVVQNFQSVFKGETFFKNVYMTHSDWDSGRRLTKEQLLYALNNVEFPGRVVDVVLADFQRRGMTLSASTTLFPRCVASRRRDERYLAWRREGFVENKPDWRREDPRPAPRAIGAAGCVFGTGNPEEIRNLQDFEKIFGSGRARN